MDMTLSKFGPYSPGKYGLPHHGELIADYRRRKGWTQADLATACGKDIQTIVNWERQDYLKDMDRRIFLHKLLHIPAGYLGLTWRSVIPEGETGIFSSSLEESADLIQESAYGLYEDLLLFSYNNPDRYSPEATYRFYKHQQEIETLLPHVPGIEKNAWVDLLCSYLQLSTFIAQHHKEEAKSFAFADRAVQLAQSLEDEKQTAASLFRRSRIHFIQERHQEAKDDISSALGAAKSLHGSVKGSSLLLSAEIGALFSDGNEKAKTDCKKQQDEAANLLYKFGEEDDGTHVNFSLYGVHHERAKTLLRFSLFHTNNKELFSLLNNPNRRADPKILADVRGALELAKKHLGSPSMHIMLTEARYYLVKKEYEACAILAKQTLLLARQRHSQQGIADIWELYGFLNQLAPNNVYVVNLGVELGVFS